MFFQVLNICPVHFDCAYMRDVCQLLSVSQILLCCTLVIESMLLFFSSSSKTSIYRKAQYVLLVSYISVTCQMSTVTGH